MKTIYRIVVAIVICMTQTQIALAQNTGKWSLTPKVGLTNGHWVGDHAAYESNRLGWTIGVDAENKICKRLSLSFGLQYSQIGSTDDIIKTNYIKGVNYLTTGIIFLEDGIINITDSHTFSNQRKNLGYLQIPVLANLYLTKGLSIKAGLQFNLLTRAKLKYHVEGFTKFDFPDNSSNTVEFDGDETIGIFSDCSKADISVPVGISYELKNIVLDARYNFGLTRIMRHDPDRYYNRYLSITLGYKFNL